MHIDVSFNTTIKNIIFNSDDIKRYYLKIHPNTKYSLDSILNEIFYVLKTGISWRDLRSSIKWQSIYFHFQRFVKFNIFKKLYLQLREPYFANNKTDIQIIDSTFIANKCGKNKIARNVFFKNKNCNKVSLLTDVNGIPLSVLVNSGNVHNNVHNNVHDNSFINAHINDIAFLNKNKKTLLLADKAYEGKNIRDNLKNNNYSLMVAKKKNAKTKYKFNKETYKKRIVIENTFQKLKIFRRIQIRYDSLVDTYFGFLFIAISIIIFKNI